MSNSFVRAFFVGRAVAEVLSERLECALTDALSELGKFDAELREQMRQFTEEVMERANKAADAASNTGIHTTTEGQSSSEPADLQAMIDELRAEIALLRTELQRYRSSKGL